MNGDGQVLAPIASALSSRDREALREVWRARWELNLTAQAGLLDIEPSSSTHGSGPPAERAPRRAPED